MGNLFKLVGGVAVLVCTYKVGKVVGKVECLKDMSEVIKNVCMSEKDDDAFVVAFGNSGVHFYKKKVSNDESN